jgi:TrpR-related protein YerC/YecD
MPSNARQGTPGHAAARKTREGDLVVETWQTAEAQALIDAILRLETADEAGRFLRDLCTLGELRALAQRWAVARLLDEGLHYAEISHRTGASTATITRIASWLNHGEGGYRLMLDRLGASGGPGSATAPSAR